MANRLTLIVCPETLFLIRPDIVNYVAYNTALNCLLGNDQSAIDVFGSRLVYMSIIGPTVDVAVLIVSIPIGSQTLYI